MGISWPEGSWRAHWMPMNLVDHQDGGPLLLFAMDARTNVQ